MSLFDHDEAGAARILGVSPRTLRGYRKQGLIGHHQLPGGRVRYTTEQLVEFVGTTGIRAAKRPTLPRSAAQT